MLVEFGEKREGGRGTQDQGNGLELISIGLR